MLLDARELAAGTELLADVCVLGAGPAGITLALDLAAAGISVVLLESGGIEPDPATQALAGGEAVGEQLRFERFDETLADTRLRTLGGTSMHWGGICRPLDPIDFAPRPELGRGGWPFGREELDPWYERAHKTIELGAFDYDPTTWFEHQGQSPLATGDLLQTTIYQVSPLRFGTRYRAELESATTLRCVLWANVLELVPMADGRHVRRVEAATLGGTRLAVLSEVVVLALGGIEVPRLMLASQGASVAGLGNERDLVGRHFSEHPHLPAGRVVLAGRPEQVRPYTIGPAGLAEDPALYVWAGFALAPDVLAEEGLCNTSVAIDPNPRLIEPTADLAPSVVDLVTAVAGAASDGVSVTARSEQVANPDDRVTLSRRLDPFGRPVARLEWRPSDADRKSLRRVLELTARELGRHGAGRLELDPGGRRVERGEIDVGNHHMGTTRMDPDAARGVVDPDSRVHTVDNLYVAGSAVFPTSGYANPTLTIVALAHRLAAHLIAKARG